MDFIPKNILGQVKKLKKAEAGIPQKSDSNVPRTVATSASSAGKSPRLSTVKSKPKSEQNAINESPEVRLVLKSAVNKQKKFDEIVTANNFEGQDDLGPAKEPNEYKEIISIRVPAMENLTTKELKTEADLSLEEQHRQKELELKVVTTRKEVAHLKITMQDLIRDLGVDDREYPTEMHAFLHILEEENKIYDTVFKEIIRQVHVNMIERGELLADVRERYARMFKKIPQHVMRLHTELIAHRKLNRRLSEELVRAKDHVSELLKRLDYVKKYDQAINEQAKEAQAKLVSLLSSANSAEESMESFHQLYRMQRSRLEMALRQSEQEKRLWVESSKHLATRIGHEEGISDLIQLQKLEDARLRATNHMISLIGDANSFDLNKVEAKIDEWRATLTRLSNQIVQEDFENVELLSKIQKQMRKVITNLTTNQPNNEIEAEHRLLSGFHLFDIKSLIDHYQNWATEIVGVTGRFTTARDLKIREELATSRRLTSEWTDIGLRLVMRNIDSSSGNDYLPLMDTLKHLQSQIQQWTIKLQNRAAGEDGIVNSVVYIQTQFEDRVALLSLAKEPNTPLSNDERTQNIQTLHSLIEQVGSVMNTLSVTAEKEQHKIPLLVEHWISKILEQMNTDIDSKNDENIRLHTSTVSWMVNLLLPKRVVPDTASEQYDILVEELTKFNALLLKDAADLILITDDKRDMRKVLATVSENWVAVGKRLLDVNAIKPLSAPTDTAKPK